MEQYWTIFKILEKMGFILLFAKMNDWPHNQYKINQRRVSKMYEVLFVRQNKMFPNYFPAYQLREES